MATWAWRRVRLPLLRPLRVGGLDLPERVVVEISRDPGGGRYVAIGEASPLPGLHDASLDDVVAALPEAVGMFEAALPASPQPSILLTGLGTDGRWLRLPPPLQCGMEQVAVQMMAGRADPTPVLAAAADLPIGETPRPAVLVDGDEESVRRAACVKVKVGRRDRDTDISLLRSLRARLGEDVEIRLDANRAFTLHDAVALAEALPDLRPSFIEEPVHDPTDLAAFMMLTGWSVALDETLLEMQHLRLVNTLPAAWVIKPSQWGIRGALGQFRAALNHPEQPTCIVSSSFEGPRGLAVLDALASCAPGHPAPGLGTTSWFGAPERGEWMAIDGAR